MYQFIYYFLKHLFNIISLILQYAERISLSPEIWECYGCLIFALLSSIFLKFCCLNDDFLFIWDNFQIKGTQPVIRWDFYNWMNKVSNDLCEQPSYLLIDKIILLSSLSLDHLLSRRKRLLGIIFVGLTKMKTTFSKYQKAI